MEFALLRVSRAEFLRLNFIGKQKITICLSDQYKLRYYPLECTADDATNYVYAQHCFFTLSCSVLASSIFLFLIAMFVKTGARGRTRGICCTMPVLFFFFSHQFCNAKGKMPCEHRTMLNFS